MEKKKEIIFLLKKWGKIGGKLWFQVNLRSTKETVDLWTVFDSVFKTWFLAYFGKFMQIRGFLEYILDALVWYWRKYQKPVCSFFRDIIQRVELGLGLLLLAMTLHIRHFFRNKREIFFNTSEMSKLTKSLLLSGI